MINIFPYYTILLLIFFFLCFNLRKNIRVSPKKIKSLFSIVFILGVIRYVSIFINVFIDYKVPNEIMKIGYFLNFIYIPIMIIICFYIFLRNNNINFNIIKRIFIIVTTLYGAVIFFLKGKTTISWEYGYIVALQKETIFNGLYMFILVLTLVYIIIAKKSSFSNLKGMSITLLALGTIIVENGLYMIGINYFPQCLISELLVVYVCYMALKTFEIKS